MVCDGANLVCSQAGLRVPLLFIAHVITRRTKAMTPNHMIQRGL
jgi:hypothetical protein